jgi:hypothetical protein
MVDWDSLKESDLDLSYTFVYTFYDKDNPNSVFNAEVTINFDKSLKSKVETKVQELNNDTVKGLTSFD